MQYKDGGIFVVNNAQRLAVVVKHNEQYVYLFWQDICRTIPFPRYRVKNLLQNNMWSYIEV